MSVRRKYRIAVLTAAISVCINTVAAGADEPFCTLARQSGTPQIPGVSVIYLSPLGDIATAHRWENIVIHQMEGPPGAAKNGAQAQAKDPARRGVTLWFETDGTVYWAVPENAVPTHGDGANRNDNKYIANATTYRRVLKDNSLGIEFAGNFPDVRKPATPEQTAALLKLLPFLQERYGIPPDRIYAHNWIDFKDSRYCEGCELAERRARSTTGRGAAAPERAGSTCEIGDTPARIKPERIGSVTRFQKEQCLEGTRHASPASKSLDPRSHPPPRIDSHGLESGRRLVRRKLRRQCGRQRRRREFRRSSIIRWRNVVAGRCHVLTRRGHFGAVRRHDGPDGALAIQQPERSRSAVCRRIAIEQSERRTATDRRTAIDAAGLQSVATAGWLSGDCGNRHDWHRLGVRRRRDRAAGQPGRRYRHAAHRE